MKAISIALSEKQNNFDVLRLFAALLVLWAHSYPLTAAGHDHLSNLLCGYDFMGSFAVLVFFVISGFLVTKSASERSTSDYLLARALRITPALVVVVFFTVFCVGPILTNVLLREYFRDGATISYIKNVLIFGIQYDIPYATSKLIYPGSINSSLWTLSLEFGFYIILAVLFFIKPFPKHAALIMAALFVAAFAYCHYVLAFGWEHQGPYLWKGASTYTVVKNGAAFFLGGAIWAHRETVILSKGMLAACLIALYAAAGTASAQIVYILTVPYIVLFLALGTAKKVNLHKIGDLSYGVYLFAFPIQQTIVGLVGPEIKATPLSLIATPIVLALAWVSWRFVEKPCLRLKPRRPASPEIGAARIEPVASGANL